MAHSCLDMYSEDHLGDESGAVTINPKQYIISIRPKLMSIWKYMDVEYYGGSGTLHFQIMGLEYHGLFVEAVNEILTKTAKMAKTYGVRKVNITTSNGILSIWKLIMGEY